MKSPYRVSFSFALVATLSLLALGALNSRSTSGPQPAASSDLSKPSYVITPIPMSAVHHHQTAAPRIRIDESTSGNWSGYAALAANSSGQAGSVTDVRGSWIVPTVTGARRTTTYSSSWVGIDGYSDGTVEQLGTESDWTSKGQRNYAWFEMYPAGAYKINGFPVVSGDEISAEVTYVGNNVYQLTIVNYTHPASFVVPSSYTTSSSGLRTSAEWVVEAPSSFNGILPLANFGTAYFSGCEATINGTTGPINTAGWFVDPLTMVDPKGGTATPSGLTDSAGTSSFSVTYSQ
jgi:hypothetical protein